MNLNWQILLIVIILCFSVLMPIYYTHKKNIKIKKLNDELKKARQVTEKEKIRVYINQINEKFRNNRK